MDKLLRLTIGTLALKAGAYCLVGVLLFFSNLWLASREVAVGQVPALIGISTVLFAGSLIGSFVYLRLMRQGGCYTMTYYLVNKLLRLLLAIGTIVLYAVVGGSNLLVFAINLLVFYFVGMVISLAYYSRMERNLPKNK